MLSLQQVDTEQSLIREKKDNYKKRLYSLDLLKLICMFFIVCGHGFLYGSTTLMSGFSTQRVMSSFISSFFCVAVNVFVLISGYFLVNQRFHIKRLIILAIEVFFYSFLILIINKWILKTPLSMKDIVTMLLPISFGHYWFISAYFGLSLLSPVINRAINSMTKRQHLFSILIMIVCFSLWSDFIPRSNAFGVGSGYCLTWFIVLYFIAAYIRKYIDIATINKRKALIIYCALMIIVFVLNELASLISRKLPMLNEYELNTFFSRYNCLLVVMGSVALFCAFLPLDLSKMRQLKLITSSSKTTLGIYLIHGGPYTSHLIWSFMFSVLSIDASLSYPFKVILVSIILYSVCLCIDFIRNRVFLILENSTWFCSLTDKLEKKLKELLGYIYRRTNC